MFDRCAHSVLLWCGVFSLSSFFVSLCLFLRATISEGSFSFAASPTADAPAAAANDTKDTKDAKDKDAKDTKDTKEGGGGGKRGFFSRSRQCPACARTVRWRNVVVVFACRAFRRVVVVRLFVVRSQQLFPFSS